MKDKNINRKIGAAGVMRVRAELLARGFDVAEPDVDCGVDLIAWDHRKIYRIQVKTTVQRHSEVSAIFHTTRLTNKAQKSRSPYDPREIDFVICVCIPLNQFWIIPANFIAGTMKTTCHVDDDFNNKWFLLSRNGRKVDGVRLEQRIELKRKLQRLELEYSKLVDAAVSSYKDKKELKLKISNFEKFLYRKNYNKRQVDKISKFGCLYTAEEEEDRIDYLEKNGVLDNLMPEWSAGRSCDRVSS